MAIIDQAEIDALLQEAGDLSGSANESSAAAAPMQAAAPAPSATHALPRDPKLARVYRVRVPVIVQLARRTMPIAAVRELAVGAIIEFEKCVEDELDLYIADRKIGNGACVKVGENFGLRVTQICDRRKRVESIAGV